MVEICAEKNGGVFFHMQVDIAFKMNGSRQKYTFRNDNTPAPGCIARLYRFSEGIRTQSFPVSNSSVIRDQEIPVRENRRNDTAQDFRELIPA